MLLRTLLPLLIFVFALAAAVDPHDLFVVKDSSTGGGCAERLPNPLGDWLSECETLVSSGLQALSDAAAGHKTAQRYLLGHFKIDATADIEAMAAVRDYLTQVKEFLGGVTPQSGIPHLFCDDTWLMKLQRTDAAWDSDKDLIMILNEDDVNQDAWAPVAIENLPQYQYDLWELNSKGQWVSNKNVPYWSDDLNEYIFDSNYRGKTFCTSSKANLAAAQDQTIPRTITLCPSCFTNPNAVEALGDTTPEAGMGLDRILPKSVTIFHELFHLVIGNLHTADAAYLWSQQQTMLKNPATVQKGETKTNAQRIRENPESFVFFTVGYWYFQQTNREGWNTASNRRWTFESGVAELIEM